ncbi:MAG: hypothetical protein PHD51_03450 [Patescibacteria group bacterium]|nr:hypothetical protein [Patescibacteria group bacterium]MDD5490967.1 hypothetical protein [Patescibacteria group bacterium]
MKEKKSRCKVSSFEELFFIQNKLLRWKSRSCKPDGLPKVLNKFLPMWKKKVNQAAVIEFYKSFFGVISGEMHRLKVKAVLIRPSEKVPFFEFFALEVRRKNGTNNTKSLGFKFGEKINKTKLKPNSDYAQKEIFLRFGVASLLNLDASDTPIFGLRVAPHDGHSAKIFF